MSSACAFTPETQLQSMQCTKTGHVPIISNLMIGLSARLAGNAHVKIGISTWAHFLSAHHNIALTQAAMSRATMHAKLLMTVCHLL